MKTEITIKAVIITRDNGKDDILGMDYISKFDTPKELYDDLWDRKLANKIRNFFMLESEPLAGTCSADFTGNTADEYVDGGTFAFPKYIGLGADHEDYVLNLDKEIA